MWRIAQRRWLRWLALGLAALLLVTAGVYGWALLSTGRSTIARAMIWGEADVGDQERFPARTIEAGGDPSPLPVGREPALAVAGEGGAVALDDALRETDTLAFLVMHNDRIAYERYYGESGSRTLETSWSVAKSFVSTLVGIAIDRGQIGGVDDPVTRYVPELAERDPRFARISLGDLMSMRSGLRYEEGSGFPWPWSDDTYTYYGVDLRDEALGRTEIVGAPGRDWHYNNYNPLLLGLVLERATRTPVAEYLAHELWQPLGAASDASWSLDSNDSGFEKMESGLNATARDYARFGLLMLHGGRLQGERVVSRRWVRAATRAQTPSDYANPYGYFWWVDGQRPGRFYAFGNYGQYIYVDPIADMVVVRLGSDWGLDNQGWLALFHSIADQLTSATRKATDARSRG